MSAAANVQKAGERIVLAHGGGGELMGRLLRDHVLSALSNEHLAPLTDGAVLPWDGSALVFTTDSYVVTPLEFPGGDIGRLAVVGTVNDLSVMGAAPVALSLGLILEEGLPLAVLDRVVASIAATASEAGVQVVTGDTKVIERQERAGTIDDSSGGMFINTSGIGRMRPNPQLSVDRVAPGDAILLNGTLADHGLAIMSLRNGIEFETPLRSDAAPLNGLIADMLATGADIKFLRDATRGGLAGVLADISAGASVSIEVAERDLRVTPTTRHAAELLGLDPLTIANEGKVVCVVAEKGVGPVLEAMCRHPLGREAARIGRIADTRPPLVELLTRAGGRRIVQRPYGEELPRIC
ncbi:MAG: hydrogenase expression/formation protein HypE [Planctomycetes bacterium]|nr:hydrogenase expression/formation protein HypE [Planctomycetota bacterium]